MGNQEKHGRSNFSRQVAIRSHMTNKKVITTCEVLQINKYSPLNADITLTEAPQNLIVPMIQTKTSTSGKVPLIV